MKKILAESVVVSIISKDEIDKTIIECESRDTSFANCERLAWLYIVRDHLTEQRASQPAPLETSKKSEFLKAADGKNSVKVFDVMDELMMAVQALHPRMYVQVLERLKKI